MDPLHAFVQAIDYPMLVVTAAAAGERSGCLVGFATQCSIDPPRLLVCLSVKNHTHRLALRSDALAMHLLGSGQQDIAALFGGETSDTVEKFSRCRWSTGATGAPIIEPVVAWVEGLVVERHALGDHTGFLLDPVGGGAGTEQGQLMFHDARRIDPGHPA